MGGEWIEKKLADACSSIDYGLTASACEEAVGPRFLRITDIVSGFVDWNTVPFVGLDDDTFPKYQLHDGDIVLARTGASTGSSLYVKQPPRAVFASYLVRLKIREQYDPRFVAYYLKSDRFWSYIRGVLGDKSAQPNASASTMTQAPLCAPKDKKEQRAIAHILGTLDDKIELNRRMNETLEAMTRAIFKSWFVDFDPVRAKHAVSKVEGAEGRDPGLPKPIADLFPDSLEDSELGEIPKGWQGGKVGDLANLSREGVNPSEFPEEEFDLFSIPAFDEGRRPKAETGGIIKSNKFLVPSAAVLLSKLNPRIPRIWLPRVRDSHRAVCSTEFLVTLPRTGISREFLYCFFSSDAFAGVFETLVTGTSGSHQRVKSEGLLAMDTVIPSEPVIHQFTHVVRSLLTRVNQALNESETLATLRDTLLPKLISGELRVPDAERIIGRHA